jgi:hypothetical protein
MTDRDVLRQCAVAAAVAGGILSGATGEYGDSGRSESRVLPANYAFAIWLPIYAGAVGYTVRQALPSTRRDPLLRRTGAAFAASVGLSGLWVRAPHPGLQLPLIAATTSTALLAYARAAPADDAERASASAGWLVRAPLGLYAGWVTLAAVAATTELFAKAAVPVPWPGADAWGSAALAATAAAAARLARRLPVSAGYPAAVAWGLAGVAVRTAGRYPVPGATAALGSGAVAVAGIRSLRRNAA